MTTTPTQTPGSQAPGRNVSGDPLWGRAYKISILTNIGENIVLADSAWEPEALRCVFEIQESTLPSPFWFATLTVYNLDNPDITNLMYGADWITISAGYQTGANQSSIIWEGPVLQSLFDRPHVVDSAISFNCVVGPYMGDDGFLNYAEDANRTQYNAVSRMINLEGGNPQQDVSKLAQARLAAQIYPRGKTFWGATSQYIHDMAESNFITKWIDFANRTKISEHYDPQSNFPPAIIYGPPFPPGYVTSAQAPQNSASSTGLIKRSLIGTPRQSQWGVVFTVLLDPNVHVGVPPMLVQIDQGALIAQYKRPFQQPPTVTDQSGIYVVGKVIHRGDTRGNEWYTEITGYTRLYSGFLLDGRALAQQGT